MPTDQTTRLASFGLILVVTAHPNPPHTFQKSIEPKYNINHQLVYAKTRRKKDIPRAQTTPDASFELVFVIADEPNLSFLLKRRSKLFITEMIIQKIKKHVEERKTYLRRKQRIWRCLDPFFVTGQPNPPRPFKTSIEPKQNKTITYNYENMIEKKKKNVPMAQAMPECRLGPSSSPSLTLASSVPSKCRQSINKTEIIQLCSIQNT